MDSSTDNSRMECSSSKNQSPEPLPELPRLCTRDCGFYGTPENRGLCSKCYTDSLKVKMSKSKASILGKQHTGVGVGVGVVPSSDIQSKISVPTEEETRKVDGGLDSLTITKNNNAVVKNRCGSCSKKVGLLGFECRCGGTYCGRHRFPEVHSCKFDFKKAGKIIIQKENPVCKADKIKDRI